MDKAVHCCSTQLIDGDGELNVDGLESFVKAVELGRCGVSYAVVSIMGPQSSGKSTLLNHLFGTNFLEMDACKGRSQTTRGLWLAKADGIEPLIIVMDLEGNDGKERAKDDTSFEKQISLFALAVSDVLLINMWCHDIGRDAAANRPLLKTVFTVMMRILSPRKTTLMFVIRDKTKTHLDLLEASLRIDVEEIWDSAPKPKEHQQTPLWEFFDVKVVALPSYEYLEDPFKEQVASLKERFFQSTSPDWLVGDRSGATPGSAFCHSARQIWRDIKENKDLHLPNHKIMVATYYCEEIAGEKYSIFAESEEWHQMEEALQSGDLVPYFGQNLAALIDRCLEGYELEAMHFDEGVRSVKRNQLEARLLQLMEPAFRLFLSNSIAGTIEEFRNTIDEALSGGPGFSACSQRFLSKFKMECADALIERAKTKWDASKRMEDGLSELAQKHKETLFEDLSKPVRDLLDQANFETWPEIRKLLQDKMASVFSRLSSELAKLGVDNQKEVDTLAKLRAYAKDLVEAEARKRAETVLKDMKQRFLKLFDRDSELNPRIWTAKEDFKAISKKAYSASLQLLSVRAVILLEVDDEKDQIYSTLKRVLLDAKSTRPSIKKPDPWASKNWAEVLLGANDSRPGIRLIDPLASKSWAEVLSSTTLIMPDECTSLWWDFKGEIRTKFNEAKAVWKSAKRKKQGKRIAEGVGSVAMQLAIDAAGTFIGTELSNLITKDSNEDSQTS